MLKQHKNLLEKQKYFMQRCCSIVLPKKFSIYKGLNSEPTNWKWFVNNYGTWPINDLIMALMNYNAQCQLMPDVNRVCIEFDAR